jgi:hypothetical protein
MNRNLRLLIMLLLGMSLCGALASAADNERKSNVAAARQGRILFSHMSVGANIIDGIKPLDAAHSAPRGLRVASLEEALASNGPALIDISGGRNMEPKTKIDFFAGNIRREARLKPDLAFMKLCFVDFNPRTDVEG